MALAVSMAIVTGIVSLFHRLSYGRACYLCVCGCHMLELCVNICVFLQVHGVTAIVDETVSLLQCLIVALVTVL